MKKKYKKPFLLRLLPTVFFILEKISPNLSGKFALYLFLHPPKHIRPDRELKCYQKAKRSWMDVEGLKIASYEWGEGPIVIIMHGWAGRATQMSSFISPLVKAGYKVIGLDAPAHGDSEGKESSVLHFEKALAALQLKYGKAHAYIGHSLGGGAGFYAMIKGLTVEKYVSISAPILPELILHEAFDKIGVSDKSKAAMCDIIHIRAGLPFAEITAKHWAKSAPDIDYLLIHDLNDKEASIEHCYALAEILPKAKTIYSEGLGHVRILRDLNIINEVVAFIRS